MIWLRVSRQNPDRRLIRRAAGIALHGGLVVYPTDTVYGLGTNPLNEGAVARVYEAKRRSRDKPLPVLVSGLEAAERLAELPQEALVLAEKYWPGALTIIVYAKPVVPCIVTGCSGKVALRVPGDRVALLLIEEAGGALIGTRANISGQPSPRTAEEAVRQLGRVIDVVVDAGPALHGRPSTVIDLTEKPPRVVREGVLEAKRVLRELGYG